MLETQELENWRPERPTLPRQEAAATPVRRSFMPGLRARLTLFFMLLLMVIAVIGVFVVTRLVAVSAAERFDNQLVAASRAASDGVVRLERRHLQQLQAMALTGGVPEAFAARDGAALQAKLAPLAADNGAEVVSAVGLDGRDLLTLYRQPGSSDLASSAGADYSGVAVLQQVLTEQSDALGDKFTQITTFPAGAYLLSAAPVRDSGGKLAGALMVGTRLDGLLAELKTQTLSDLALLDSQGHLVASTLPAPDEGFAALELPPANLPGERAAFTRDIRLYNRDFRALYSPLMVRQAQAGALAIVLPDEYFASTLAANRTWILTLFIAGTIGLLMVGYALAQSIAQPILRLEAVANAAAAGDLRQSTGLAGHDEIGALAGALDTLVDQLRDRNLEVRRLAGEVQNNTRALSDSRLQLEATQQQLIQADKLAAVGALTAGIANEFRQPLAAISQAAETLAQRQVRDADLQRELRAIRDSAAEATRLVEDLLKFTRRAPMEIAPQDLRQTVAGAVQLTQAMARDRGVALEIDVPAEPLVAEHDARQLEQVLVNLIHNGLEAMPDGGRLSLHLRALADGAGIVVQDTGGGMAPEDLGRVFDPLYTTSPEGKPAGLGLSVSQAIVTAHHGRIDVASRAGEGTIFSVWLPTQQPASAGGPHEAA